MKVEKTGAPSAARPGASFTQALKQAPGAVRARPAPQAPAPVATRARVPPSAGFEHALHGRRSEAEAHRPEHRRLAAELARRLRPEPVPEPPQQAPVPAPPAPPPPVAVRAEDLAERIHTLLERAELSQRAEGPALELALSEGSTARLRVTRTAKGEVTVRLEARTASERRALALQAGQLRASLAERGLKVRELRFSGPGGSVPR